MRIEGTTPPSYSSQPPAPHGLDPAGTKLWNALSTVPGLQTQLDNLSPEQQGEIGQGINQIALDQGPPVQQTVQYF